MCVRVCGNCRYAGSGRLISSTFAYNFIMHRNIAHTPCCVNSCEAFLLRRVHLIHVIFVSVHTLHISWLLDGFEMPQHFVKVLKLP